jgi:HD-like signal output (HDOD) protein/GGDEF domain-containing protein
MNDGASQLEEIASRAVTLYSRPTVALELMRLTDQPGVEASALRDCVAQDPALTCKILRVVNSSLYGLHRPVADLNQAIGLLGIKPLKLLVLGFNLPDALFAEVAARELEWYWTNTLTRAVAARLIAEQVWRQSGDEPFIAGLLQDIGILVLLRELGEPYAKFLTGVIDEKCHLASLEQDTLGFDHVQLSAALLSRWQLPERLVAAIAAPKKLTRLSRMMPAEGDLPQILHLAEMLMELVGQRRLNVLVDLLEAGKVYRGMTKSKLATLVEGLQPQVDQLAESLSLDLSEERDYVQILKDANEQMAAIGEQIASDVAAASREDQIYDELLAHTSELTNAMQTFLKAGGTEQLDGKRWAGKHAAHTDDKFVRQPVTDQFAECKDGSALARKLLAAASRCRKRRQELSLLLLEPNVYDIHSDTDGELARQQARESLSRACGGLEEDEVMLVAVGGSRVAAILLNCDRPGALAIANQAISELSHSLEQSSHADLDPATTLSVGVATAGVVPRNFDAQQLIDSASRCLSAARTCGISTVKSIEV